MNLTGRVDYAPQAEFFTNGVHKAQNQAIRGILHAHSMKILARDKKGRGCQVHHREGGCNFSWEGGADFGLKGGLEGRGAPPSCPPVTGVGITQNYHLSIRLNTLYDWKMVVATFFGILVNSGILVIAMLASGLNSVVYQFFSEF